jgi:excisionase family DNA binding protein
VNVGQLVNVATRFSSDASPQLQVSGEHMSDSPNRKISVPKRLDARSTRIELRRPKTDRSSEPLAFTYQQAADALQVSVSTIKRRVESGDLHVVMIGTLPRIPKASIQQLLGEA